MPNLPIIELRRVEANIIKPICTTPTDIFARQERTRRDSP